MTKSEFEVIAKNIVSNCLYLCPDGESIRLYKKHYPSGDFYTVEIGRFEYAHYSDDDIRITAPEEIG